MILMKFGSDNLGVFKVLRSIRALRPLRSVSFVGGLQVSVYSCFVLSQNPRTVQKPTKPTTYPRPDPHSHTKPTNTTTRTQPQPHKHTYTTTQPQTHIHNRRTTNTNTHTQPHPARSSSPHFSPPSVHPSSTSWYFSHSSCSCSGSWGTTYSATGTATKRIGAHYLSAFSGR